MKLYHLLKPELVKVNCQSTNTAEVLKEMVRDLKLKDMIKNDHLVLEKLLEKERMGATSMGNNSAVPHARLNDLKAPIIYIGVSKNGIQYNEDDKEPVHLIILILSPANSIIAHLQVLQAAASLIKKKDRLIKAVRAADSPDDLINVIKKYETLDDD